MFESNVNNHTILYFVSKEYKAGKKAMVEGQSQFEDGNTQEINNEYKVGKKAMVEGQSWGEDGNTQEIDLDVEIVALLLWRHTMWWRRQ